MTQHTEHSSFREKLIEHLFIGELLKLSWLHHRCSLEIARPEVDFSGYDCIAEVTGVIRHIQIKTSIIGSTTKEQKIHTKLGDKQSGCMVWIFFKEHPMELGPFLFFGGLPGQPLPSLEGLKTAKHTKGNKDGIKAKRQNLRVLPKRRFEEVETIEDIYARLFGKVQHRLT